MAELDDIIHQPLRLKIMAALNSLPATAAGNMTVAAPAAVLSKMHQTAADRAARVSVSASDARVSSGYAE